MKGHILLLLRGTSTVGPLNGGQKTENMEGSALDELIETNNMQQLIDEPTNVRGDGMSCIDLIITDQPNMFVEAGVHPSLDEYCQHQIVYGKVNVRLPPPPPYHRKIWDYPMANDRAIIDAITSIDWQSKFTGIGPEEMTSVLPMSYIPFLLLLSQIE